MGFVGECSLHRCGLVFVTGYPAVYRDHRQAWADRVLYPHPAKSGSRNRKPLIVPKRQPVPGPVMADQVKSVQHATFGAGCFWGIEEAFRTVDGVLGTATGYMGGVTQNPTYEQICTGETGHAEVVQVTFDPAGYPTSSCSISSGRSTIPRSSTGRVRTSGRITAR